MLLPAMLFSQTPEDPYLWLEEVEGRKPLEWVKERNDKTLGLLKKVPLFDSIYQTTLRILDSRERIPYPSLEGGYVYNFWRDEKNPRGLWRRTTLDSYLARETSWESLLDVDALARAEGVNWVFKGAVFGPQGSRRCMIALSRGGADAVQHREFDLSSRAFAEDGFTLPEAKGGVDWADSNSLYVATDFGPGSMTTSGYPRIVKLWRRGTALEDAEVVFEGQSTDVGAGVGIVRRTEGEYHIVRQGLNFYEGNTFLRTGGALVKLDVPLDAEITLVKGQIVLFLKSDWTAGGVQFRQGSLIGMDFRRFLAGERAFSIILQPDERSGIEGTATTRDHLLVLLLRNVRSELWQFDFEGGQWNGARVSAPEFGTIGIAAVSEYSNLFFLDYKDFLQPTTLYVRKEGETAITAVRSLPRFFDAGNLVVNQYEATSRDGTRIPYFVVHSRSLPMNGEAPTLLRGYGGFEVPQKPNYSASLGANWLERGGVYALANIRGGGEFGPAWHRAALKENRQRSFDDFIAVAEDLVARKITSPKHLGIEGGSNGGLLVGVAFTQRPDLFNAVACRVPLLDMKRYHKLLAGASWMAEFGNPDNPAEWTYIKAYSPYHNLRTGVRYPRVLFQTTTRDDRVHPGHARKMAARMEEMGHPFLYFENTEGGHGTGSTNAQVAFMEAIFYAYLHSHLGGDAR